MNHFLYLLMSRMQSDLKVNKFYGQMFNNFLYFAFGKQNFKYLIKIKDYKTKIV